MLAVCEPIVRASLSALAVYAPKLLALLELFVIVSQLAFSVTLLMLNVPPPELAKLNAC